MLLQSHDRFDSVASLNLATGEVRYLSKRDRGDAFTQRTAGWYSHLDGRWIAMYVDAGQIFLAVDRVVHQVGPETQTKVVRTAAQNSLIVYEAKNPVLSLEYKPTKIDPPLSVDPTPFVEEEHHDFGLFVHNVLSNQERREAFKKANS